MLYSDIEFYQPYLNTYNVATVLLLLPPAMPLASLFGSHPCERHGLPECVLARADVQDGKTVSWRKW